MPPYAGGMCESKGSGRVAAAPRTDVDQLFGVTAEAAILPSALWS